jgi:hypothetical protein
MNYNQEIQDSYTNDKDKDRWETHPVWYMSMFPEATKTLEEEARINYCRVMEEEGYRQQGYYPPRLQWADQFRSRARVAYIHKFNYSDAYKEYLGNNFKPLPYLPSW